METLTSMKTVLLSLFLTSTLTSFSQKHETKIIVTVTDTSGVIKKVVDVLNERGYTVDQQSDKFVSTKERTVSKAKEPAEIKIKAFLKDSVLIFSGEFKVNITFMGTPPSFWDIENRGVKGSVFKITWSEMEDIAKQFGDNIVYAK
jgi:hypothetical protein